MTPAQKAAADKKLADDKAAEDKRKADEAAAAATKANADSLAIQGALTNLTSQIAQLGGRVDVLAQERVNRGEPATPANKGFQRTVSVEQIEQALDEGDTKRANRLQLTYNTETIQESQQGVLSQIQSLQDQGVSMIANVVKDQVSSKLPYYTKYKDEIDKFLEQAPAASRTHPDMHKWAHDAIVGRHVADIAKEAAEEAVRKHMDGGGGYAPGTGGSGGNEQQGLLTIDEVYGDDAKDIKNLLRNGKMTFLQIAQRRGFADEQSYLKHVKDFREKEAKEAV